MTAVIERPEAGSDTADVAAASAALTRLLSESDGLDLGTSVESLGVPVHIAARAVTALLASGAAELTEDQKLRLVP
jgi:hypothetical protein